MTTEEVVRWIRLEHEKVEYLSDELRKVVAYIPRANMQAWISDAGRVFEHFRAHVIKHMALEEREGYLVAVSERRPALATQVERLKHEHIELGRILDEIARGLTAVCVDDRLLIRDLCRRIDNLLGYVEHHENEENLLVTSAFTFDIGTTD